MRNRCISVFIYLFALTLESQAAFTKLWDYRLGGSDNESPRKIYETLDHGFLVCGSSNSNNTFDKSEMSRGFYDFWIVKTDSAGNILWDKTYGGMDDEEFTCVVLLPDSGFLVGGSSRSDSSGEKSQNNHDLTMNTFDFWVIKIDKFGNKIWDKTFGGDEADLLINIAASSNGSFLLAGNTYSSLNGDMTHLSYGTSDYWAVKIDSAGNKLWDMNYGGGYYDYFSVAAITSDNGFILGGTSSSPAGNSKSQNNINSSIDYWILKIDSNGIQLWDKTIGGDDYDKLCTLNVLSNDYLLLGGISGSNIGFDKSIVNHGSNLGDYWFVKTDNMGIKIWDNVFGGNGFEEDLNNVCIINGGFLITGTSYSNISGDKSEDNILNTEQPWVLAIDSFGNKIWDLTLNTVTHAEMCYGIQSYDGCFVFLSYANTDGGYVSQNRNSYFDYWISKFCMDSNMPVASYLSSSTAFCQNTCLDFTNLSTNALSYQWFFPGGTPSTSTQPDPQGICYNTSGTFDVTLVAMNGNGSDTMTLPQYLTVYPQVPFTSISQIGDTLFSVPGYATYQWYADTVLISGASNYYYVAQHSGDYSVIVTDSNGCFATAFMTNVIASENEIESASYYFHVYSCSNQIIIESEITSPIEAKILISNTLGEIIYGRHLLLKNGRNEIFIDDLKPASGLYIVAIQFADQNFYKKVFIN